MGWSLSVLRLALRAKSLTALARARLGQICLLFCVLVACTQPVWAADQDDAFAAAIKEAESYAQGWPTNDDRAKAVECYRRALTLRPECPENMSIRARLGYVLLNMEGDPERQKEGLAILDDILTRYNYMDYYDFNPPGTSDSPQYQMITVVIYAVHGEPEKCRSYYLKGMSFLNQTYQRRLEDWRNEPAPIEPVAPFTQPQAVEKWQGRQHEWESRQAAVMSGEIFGSSGREAGYVKTLVSQYGETYGRVPPSEVGDKLQPIIHAFPGSPLEKEARRLIANAQKLSESKVQEDTPEWKCSFWLGLSSMKSDEQAALEEVHIRPGTPDANP